MAKVSKSQSQERASRILIVPFDRFDFESTFSLSEIAAANELQSDEEVYPFYRNHFIKEFSTSSTQVVLFELQQSDRRQLMSKLPRAYKRKPVTHHGYELQAYVESGKLENLMNNYAADYILFISKYFISNRLLTTKKSFENSKFLSWSRHEIDYELYDQKGELLIVGDHIQINSNSPNQANFQSAGLIAVELNQGIIEVRDKLIKLLNEIENQK
jgi:hypothetical protein